MTDSQIADSVNDSIDLGLIEVGTVLTLKKNLIDTINGSGLPISVISYVVKDVLHEVQVEEQKIIQNEIQEINNTL